MVFVYSLESSLWLRGRGCTQEDMEWGRDSSEEGRKVCPHPEKASTNIS